MLYKYTYVPHAVDNFQSYIDHFIDHCYHVRNLGRNFRITNCDVNFVPYITRAPLLNRKLRDFFHAFTRNLSTPQQILVYNVFKNSNMIEDVLNRKINIVKLSGLPAVIRDPAKQLFIYLYENTLYNNGIKEHYQYFYDNQTESNLCPFCGIERLKNPLDYKQDYDHLIYKDEYPFAAVNMLNLLPIGRDCNTIYKKTKDILFDGSGRRRTFLSPYTNKREIKIKVGKASRIPNYKNKFGKWDLLIKPSNDYTKTWNDVFEIKHRYVTEVINNDYNDWLVKFMKLTKANNPKRTQWPKSFLKSALKRHAKSFDPGYHNNLEFLRNPIMNYLADSNDKLFFKSLRTQLKLL